MLTERDEEIVRWIGRQGVAQTSDLMVRYAMGRTVTYRRVRKLVDDELLERRRLLYSDGGLLLATPSGLQFAGLEHLRRARLSLAQVVHMTTCARLAATLEAQLDGERLLTDREHRAMERVSGMPFASATIGQHHDGAPRLHRPDLVLVEEGDETGVIAIEVELTLKTRARLERILRGYGRNDRLEAIRYYAADTVAAGVRRAAHAVAVEDLLDLRPLSVPLRFTSGHRESEGSGCAQRRRAA
jgi:hypothetical protein